MSPQADFIVSNGTGAAVRSDLNVQFAAIVSNNSGATEPATMYAYQWWADTTAGLLKLRNSANSAWITMRQLDGEFSTVPVENGSAAAPSIYFKDSGTDSGFFSPGTDAVAISTAGTNRLHITSGGLVGIGTGSPSALLHVSSTGAVESLLSGGGTSGDTVLHLKGNGNAYKFIVPNSAAQYGMGLYDVGNAAYRLYVTSAGNVGVGTASPATDVLLTVGGNDTDSGIMLDRSSGDNCAIHNVGGNLVFKNGSSSTVSGLTERARIDSSGRLLVGTSTNITSQQIQSASTGGNNFGASRFTNGLGGCDILLTKSRGATVGTHTVVQSGDDLGNLYFGGSDGSSYVNAARISAAVDGTPGSNDMPGRLVFSTTADGASSPTERMRISSGGNIFFNKTTYSSADPGVRIDAGGQTAITMAANTVLVVNRTTNDGTLVSLSQDDTIEGTISVSGTTVSYNGAHLSRWSQLPGGAERTEILRGTVLSNLDEMCEWGEEENEQLNRMKVSDVEGDKNVSGVFQAWDDDDDTYTNDFYCAMTGDFIIRIAQGVTVERGDLLMSAGDGTAKPQDDDIIRSKTIAKVTSTNVSCTYEDGSYCVPCVLMAC
jgi:hypothetical protein